tara:strand:+ start:486 stop:812 length:327 start_codon:yes stop_codon:yes gene_type:complete
MSNAVDYGKLTKKVVFTENDHRHAQLLVKLKYDGMRQSEFFRHIITGYINGDERIQEYIDQFKEQSLKRKAKSRTLRTQGRKRLKEHALNEGEIENIFDLLEEEFPEL